MGFLQILAYTTLVLPLLILLIRFKRVNNKLSRVILFYLLYSISNEVLMAVLADLNFTVSYPNTRPILYAIFTIIEFLLLSIYLYNCLRSKHFRLAQIFFGIVFLITALINLFLLISSNSKSELIDTIPVSTSALILIIFSILYLFEEIQTPKIEFIYANPKFWITIGIMIYFSGTFFFFLQFSDLSSDDQSNFWKINLVCIILKNIFFTISFLLPPQPEIEIFKSDNF